MLRKGDGRFRIPSLCLYRLRDKLNIDTETLKQAENFISR